MRPHARRHGCHVRIGEVRQDRVEPARREPHIGVHEGHEFGGDELPARVARGRWAA
jgi:hypothetical protein